VIYDILEAKLIAQGFTAGETLWRNYMPADVTIGVLIKAPLSGVPIDPYITGWHRTGMQVVTRHIDPVEGMKMALAAGRILHVVGYEAYPASEERGQAHINLFQARHLPIQFPRLEGNGYEFSQNFEAAFGFTALDEPVQF
jgi:hypothetical protein